MGKPVGTYIGIDWSGTKMEETGLCGRRRALLPSHSDAARGGPCRDDDRPARPLALIIDLVDPDVFVLVAA